MYRIGASRFCLGRNRNGLRFVWLIMVGLCVSVIGLSTLAAAASGDASGAGVLAQEDTDEHLDAVASKAAEPQGVRIVVWLEDSESPLWLFSLPGRNWQLVVDAKLRTIQASGGLGIEYEDMLITANELWLDTAAGVGRLSGGVSLKSKGQTLEGQTLEVDFNAKHATLTQAEASLLLEEVDGPLYLRSGLIESWEEKVVFHGGRMTTCDLAEPHFHLQAGELALYPGDKLVVRKVSYWELDGRLPLFYWPYLVLPVERRSYVKLPEIGYSSTHGWYIKTTYNYYGEGESYGEVYLDYLQESGLGFGVLHVYDDDPQPAGRDGWVYAYVLSGPVTSGDYMDEQWELAWGQNIHLGESANAALEAYYKQGPSTTGRIASDFDLGGEVSYWLDDGELSWTTKYSRSQYRGLEPHHDLQVGGQVDLGLGEHGRLDLGGEWRRLTVGSLPVKTHYSYLLGGSYTPGRWSLDGRLERRLPENHWTNPSVKWTAREYLPEITFRLADAFPLLPGRFDLSATGGRRRQEEGSRGLTIDTMRTAYELAWRSDRIPLTDTVGLDLTGTWRYKQDDLGQHHTWTGSAGATWLPVDWFVLSVRYVDEFYWGKQQLYFDKAPLGERLEGSLTLRPGVWRIGLRSGYDIMNRQPNDVHVSITHGAGEPWRIGTSTDYSLRDQEFVSAGVLVEYTADDRHQFRLGAALDMPDYRLQKWEAAINYQLTKSMTVSYSGAYNATFDKLTTSKLQLSWEFHCRQLAFSYDGVKKEAWVEYRINAFHIPLRFGRTEQGVEFDSDEWLDFILRKD